MGVLLCKWLAVAWMLWHPFYVSVTEIRHNAAKKELEVSCRIFSDDLENVLKKQYRTPLDIIHPANRRKADEMIADYLSKHFSVTVDGKPVALRYVGYEIEEDAAWCFLSAADIPAVKQVRVRNDVLYSEHASQINMIHVIVKDVRKSTKLDNPKAEAEFGF